MIVTPLHHWRKLTEFDYHLTAGANYVVLGIEADYYRIIDDKNDPILFDPKLFTVVDPSEPADWENTYGDQGERYAGPAKMTEAGFLWATLR